MLSKEDAKKRNWIISQLRGSFRRYATKYEVLREAQTEKKINASTGRIAQHYRCNCCKKEFVQSSVQVDHIVPVMKATGFDTWDDYINSLFCSKDNLQVLCKGCHQKKTNTENKDRRSARKKL